MTKRPSDIPKHWPVKKSNTGGKKYYDPRSPNHNNTRIEPGGKNKRYPDPYRKDIRDGKYRDKDGNIVPKNSPDAHLPYCD